MAVWTGIGLLAAVVIGGALVLTGVKLGQAITFRALRLAGKDIDQVENPAKIDQQVME